MKVYIKEFKSSISLDEYNLDDKSCFLDIETTGLSRHKNIVYLIGLLDYNKKSGHWRLTQLFAEGYTEEKEILLKLIEYLSEFNQIITYNGDSFDIPFLNSRLKYNNIDYTISNENSLDIYRVLRKNSHLFTMENLKLKTLEEYLGIFREDIYSGRDCIKFYKSYISTGKKHYRERVLKHNHDDLYYLLDTIKILNIIKEKMTIRISNDENYLNLHIEEIREEGNYFIFKGSWEGNTKEKILLYESNHKILIGSSKRFEISLEFNKGLVTPEEIGLFINKEDFNLVQEIIDETHYNLANNILILKSERKLYINNIKNTISSLIVETL